jgi:anaerobic selenocysteine-containing dehydrogenase
MLFGSEIASLYLQPHIGGDIALLTGVAKDLLARGAFDREFVANSTEDFQQFVARVEATSWDDIVAQSGVAFPEIKAFADRYLAARNVVFGWTMGMTTSG